MNRLVESVPNFSEGRDPAVIDAVVAAAVAVPGVGLLDREMDADHHRCVLTFAGEAEAVLEGVLRAARVAVERIDLRKHRGQHPRMGALDVLPFIPLGETTLEDCVALARRAGERIGVGLGVPVFLYEAAATRPERKNLAAVREGQFEGLSDLIGKDPARKPDFGPDKIHPSAGATAVGARFFLVAYNINLATTDLKLAKSIAKEIRESSGGFRCVKALGMDLKDRGCVQVSMNMTDYRVTGLKKIFAEVSARAEKAGVAVLESEIVGLVPEAALADTTPAQLKLAHFGPEQVLEEKLKRVLAAR